MTDQEHEPDGSTATCDSEASTGAYDSRQQDTGQHARRFSRLLRDGKTAEQNSSRESSKAKDHVDGDEEALSEKQLLYKSIDAKGLMTLAFGVLVPAIVTLCWLAACSDRMVMLVLKHPVETVIQAAAVLNIPIANYLIWSAVTRKDLRFPLRNGILIGMATGTALVICACAFLANYLGYPVIDLNGNSREVLFAIIGLASQGAVAASTYLAVQLRNLREFRSARKMSLFFSLGGLFTAILMLISTEARPFLIRIAEYNATSEISSERDAALQTLHTLDAKRDLMMECADQRAAGIPGMFIKMDPVMQRQVYFALTGKPFRDSKASDYSAMPDDYLQRHVVGAPVEKLSLVRSAMTGTVNGENLTSTINWTFVLKNRNYKAQEARAELVLPHGAVINGVTQWAGEGSPPRAAHVGSPQQTSSSYIGSKDLSGADVTDLGRDRILVRCTAIPAQSETKLSLSIAAPLSLNDRQSTSLLLPKFVESNFNMLSENSFRIRSKDTMHLEGKALTISKNPDGEYLVAGNIKGEDLNAMNLTLVANRNHADLKTVSAYDPNTRQYFNRAVVETKQEIPSSLMVVIDGSESMKEHTGAVINSLKRLPKDLPTNVIVASTNRSTFSNEPQSLDEAIKTITQNKNAFSGGQDNLESVVKAAGIAGESKNGAVLWIHGPQAGLNKELYITAPYTAAPRFFEISIDNGADDAAELFKNHREIGPFTTLSRTNDFAADLNHFIAKWQPGSSGYEMRYFPSVEGSTTAEQLTGQDAKEFVSVCLKQEYQDLVKKGFNARAYGLAYAGNIITPDNSAVISFVPNNTTIAANGQSPHALPAVATNSFDGTASSRAGSGAEPNSLIAPSLAGATNGTIGPQGYDATYVTGVNTAGTVRVNNLANLESFLNICANCCELLGVVAGATLMIWSAAAKTGGSFLGIKLSRGSAAVLGVSIFLIGLAVPGTINWLVASARDANLFD